jgi:flagellar motility protein MotE (MotC chaperone)
MMSMLRNLIFSVALFSNLLAIEGSEKLYNCSKIFEERKDELLVELERIDEQRQALSALKIATDDLLAKKEAKLNKQESEINAKLKSIEDKETSIKSMLEENKKILEEINSKKMDKVSQMYSKMKPAAAASILGDMNVSESSKIFQTLKPKTVGKIFSKMDAKKASEITLMLTKEEK